MADDKYAPISYDPQTTRLLTFHDAVPVFLEGGDTPRAYLERCLETIEAREPQVKAFVVTNLAGARAAADASSARYKAGRPLSPVDGMPVGIKDLYETRDLPTQMNSPVYEGYESCRDAASVWALRGSGAVIVGKTTTTEFGLGVAPRTRNPFDLERTPGGSSSGSAAAVGARMLPAAIGSQVGGSIIRPAAYCANYGFKPSFGALKRAGGHSLAPSGSHLGMHAGSLEDVWIGCKLISSVAGPDDGHMAMPGGPALPEIRKPQRLVRMYTRGWERTDEKSKDIFERFLRDLSVRGIEIVEPDSHPATAVLEADFQAVYDHAARILGYEMRWPVAEYLRRGENMISPVIRERLEIGLAMDQADYHETLTWKARFQSRLADVAGLADGFVSLSSPGPAPLGIKSTGDSSYQVPTSVAGAPSMSLPLLAVDGLPLGVQVMGFHGGDDRLAAICRWLRDAFLPG